MSFKNIIKGVVVGLIIIVLYVIYLDIQGNSHNYNNYRTTILKDPQSDLSYSITSQGKGKNDFFYKVIGTVSNKSHNNYSYVQISFSCYDKDGYLIDTAIDNVVDLSSKESWKFEAMATKDGIKECKFKEMTGY